MENEELEFNYRGETYIIIDDGLSVTGGVNLYCVLTEDCYFLLDFFANNFDEAIETAKKMLDEHYIN
jgi:hypothetical protein